MKKQSIWVFEWRKSVHYWWSYILFSPECKELTSMLDPLLYRWGVPPVVIRCVHWTMQSGVLQTCIKALGLANVMWALMRDPGVISWIKFVEIGISENYTNDGEEEIINWLRLYPPVVPTPAVALAYVAMHTITCIRAERHCVACILKGAYWPIASI